MCKIPFFAAALLALLSGTGQAHFGMIIPSAATVTDKKDAAIQVQVSFSHPFEMVGMDMARPKAFRVVRDGASEDLLPALKPATVMGHKAWQADYAVRRPGVHQFVLEPEPYWEPAEDAYIAHYPKVVVASFGEEEGWDRPVGLPTEIVPLTRPFGNYAGNVFQGRVLLGGKPVPHALVEVEYYNRDKAYAAPNDYMVTQTVQADANGVFTYATPFAGWWGFAALNPAPKKIVREGKPRDVELGAVIWVEFLNPVKK